MIKVFIEHLIEFIDDILLIFPDNREVKKLKNFIVGFSKINPKAIALSWKYYITDKYQDHIHKNDDDIIDFICNKNYSGDLTDVDDFSKDLVNNFISKMKTPIRCLNKHNKKKTVQYLKNLMELSKLV